MKPSELKVGQRIRIVQRLNGCKYNLTGDVVQVDVGPNLISGAFIGDSRERIWLSDRKWGQAEITILSEPEDPIGTVRITNSMFLLFVANGDGAWYTYIRNDGMRSSDDLRAINGGGTVRIAGRIDL